MLVVSLDVLANDINIRPGTLHIIKDPTLGIAYAYPLAIPTDNWVFLIQYIAPTTTDKTHSHTRSATASTAATQPPS